MVELDNRFELNRTFDFRTLDFCKTGLGRVEDENQVSTGSSYLRITREPEKRLQALICSIQFG